MRVRLHTARARLGMVDQPGDVIDVPDDEGRRLVDTRQAEIAEAEQALGDARSGLLDAVLSAATAVVPGKKDEANPQPPRQAAGRKRKGT